MPLLFRNSAAEHKLSRSSVPLRLRSHISEIRMCPDQDTVQVGGWLTFTDVLTPWSCDHMREIPKSVSTTRLGFFYLYMVISNLANFDWYLMKTSWLILNKVSTQTIQKEPIYIWIQLKISNRVRKIWLSPGHELCHSVRRLLSSWVLTSGLVSPIISARARCVLS